MSAAAIPLTADNLSLGLMSPLPNTEIDPHAGKTLALSGLSVPDISRREPLSSNFSVKTGSLEPAATAAVFLWRLVRFRGIVVHKGC
jgi:hypothetical protein